MLTGQREIRPLTSLRFFAASLVFAEHLQMLPGLEWLGIKNGGLGIIGVRIFFILSGYIISHTYWNKDWRTGSGVGANARDFYWSRFARIYPLHWLMFLVALPLGLNSVTARISVHNVPWLITLTDRLWPGFSAGSQPVKVAWTLSCEVLFYLSTPLIFWLLARWKKTLPGSVVILTIFTTLIWTLATVWPQLNWTAYMEFPEFLLGMVGFHLSRRVDFSRWAKTMMLGGALLLLGALVLNARSANPSSFYLAFTPGALLVVLGGATISGPLEKFLSRPWLELLGHASFSLYLLHDPVLRYLKVALNRQGIVFSFATGLAVGLVVFCLCVALSVACFKLYENPVRLKLRSYWKYKGQKADRQAVPVNP